MRGFGQYLIAALISGGMGYPGRAVGTGHKGSGSIGSAAESTLSMDKSRMNVECLASQ